ncbi:MAG: head GIN domain-containing protein [Bacteroidia bacterium]
MYLQIVCLFVLFGCMGESMAQNQNQPDVVLQGKGKVTKIVRRVKPFTEISAAGPFELVLHHGKMEDASVEIDENLQQYVSVKSDGKTLKISVQKGYTFKNFNKFVVYVSFVNLDKISAAGLKKLEGDNAFHLQNLNLSFAGVEKVSMNLELNKLELSSAGGGDIILAGKANSATYSRAGGGELDVLGFKVRNVTANLVGGSNASLYTEDKMEVNINQGGAKPAKKKEK